MPWNPDKYDHQWVIYFPGDTRVVDPSGQTAGPAETESAHRLHGKNSAHSTIISFPALAGRKDLPLAKCTGMSRLYLVGHSVTVDDTPYGMGSSETGNVSIDDIVETLQAAGLREVKYVSVVSGRSAELAKALQRALGDRGIRTQVAGRVDDIHVGAGGNKYSERDGVKYHQPADYKVIWSWENDQQVMKKKGGTKIPKTEAQHQLELLEQAKDRTGKAP